MSDLVFGVGSGTFVLFFFALILLLVVCLSMPCSKADKIFYRGIALLAYIIIIVLLICADVESQDGVAADAERVVYDQSIVARLT